MRRCRADGVIRANFHPCLDGAAGQPNYWVLLAITAKKLMELYRLKHSHPQKGFYYAYMVSLRLLTLACLASVLQAASPRGISRTLLGRF